MFPSILVLTLVLWLLPFSFLTYFVIGGQIFSGAIALLLFEMYGIVWLFCRPSGFEVSPDHLEIVFPAWRRNVSFRDISGTYLVSSDEFKQNFGWAMRIGVGGLWGGFGWLWTSKGGLVEFYMSRVDGLVMIERRGGQNILVTPDEPEKFVSGMQSFIKRLRINDDGRVCFSWKFTINTNPRNYNQVDVTSCFHAFWSYGEVMI